MRRLVAVLTFVAALTATLLMTAGGANAAPKPVKCYGSFQVLHNDRIGAVPFPEGPYASTATTITCQQASTQFARFLQDWDGRLPSGWSVRLSGTVRVFTRAHSPQAFTETPQTKPTPPTPPSGLTCPGNFQVLHNDRVGAMSLPKGFYTITRLSSKAQTCPNATRWFAYFLDNDDAGHLPKPWTIDAATKTFFRGSKTDGFSVKQVSAQSPLQAPRYPLPGDDTCTDRYRVASTTAINGFTVPAGRYALTALGSATCTQALADANRAVRTGALPAGWHVNRDTGSFLRSGARFGFRLDPLSITPAFTG